MRLWKYSWSGLWGCVENVVDSSRFDQIDTNHFPCQRSICTRFARDSIRLDSIESTDRIDTNRFPCCWFVIPEVNLCSLSAVVTCLIWINWSLLPRLRTRKVRVSLFHGSWLLVVRIDTERIKSNCKVPQTSRLSLGVFDMNDYVTALTMDTASSVSEVRLKFPKFTTNHSWTLKRNCEFHTELCWEVHSELRCSRS